MADQGRHHLTNDRPIPSREPNAAALAALEACRNSPYRSIASTPIGDFATPATRFREPYEHNGDARNSATPAKASRDSHKHNTDSIKKTMNETGPYKVYTFGLIYDHDGKRGTERFLNGSYATLEQASSVAEEVARLSLNHHSKLGPCTIASITDDAGLRSYGIKRGNEYIEEVAVIRQQNPGKPANASYKILLTTITNTLRSALRFLPRSVLFLLQLLFDLHATLENAHTYLQRVTPQSPLVATADGFLRVVITALALVLWSAKLLGQILTFSSRSGGSREDTRSAYIGVITVSLMGVMIWYMGWLGGVVGVGFALLLCGGNGVV
ncbi:uncharacterized protein MYCFIDRAFT_82716 [Pseudocercospora fijiensis CIRAD86]|uniref:Uncharacterized protein n=1 Tax=Pseudocercospora fijiensis (strain CIRAD86) TaxID=383855 RepID=M3ALR9_PSEFD|nr:uncharacterized protein MYCFIDRAFT_82716 [Pseudocercospora fijiensis CIRAD86]EME85541.1 hypothetical protein MYCFIDRAFT_82716 [Pseudocercospora fijiensis CIRAD86]